MEYAITAKTVENLGIRYDAGTGETRYFFTGRRCETWVNNEEKAKRWKTKAGAEKYASCLPKERTLFDQATYLATGNGMKKFSQEYEVVEVAELTPKYQKAKLIGKQLEEKRRTIAKRLLEHGWKPNKKYFAARDADEEGFTKYADYLIDGDDRFAVTLKSSVMTVHDGSRQFCKVISMGYNEVEFGNHELVCGRIALKL